MWSSCCVQTSKFRSFNTLLCVFHQTIDCQIVPALELLERVNVTQVPLVQLAVDHQVNHTADVTFHVALPVAVSFVSTYSFVAPDTCVSALIAFCADV